MATTVAAGQRAGLAAVLGQQWSASWLKTSGHWTGNESASDGGMGQWIRRGVELPSVQSVLRAHQPHSHDNNQHDAREGRGVQPANATSGERAYAPAPPGDGRRAAVGGRGAMAATTLVSTC